MPKLLLCNESYFEEGTGLSALNASSHQKLRTALLWGYDCYLPFRDEEMALSAVK